MKKLLQLSILLSCLTVFSQAGTLDTSFGAGGKVVTSVNSGEDVARGVAIQSDGKIVVAGYTFSNVFGYDFMCLRYNSNGTLDTSFGNGGIATFDLQVGSDDRAFSIDIQLDGKLVLAGFSDDGSDRDGAVIRLNTDGSLDTSFATAGVAVTNIFEEDIYKVVKIHQVTGNIVVGGTSYEDTNESNGILARYTSNGSLDTSFSNDGKITSLEPVIGSNAEVIELVIEDLAIKSNGRITAVGWVNNLAGSFPTSDHYQCRINADGTPDATFSDDGYDFDVYTTGWDRTFSIHMYPDDSFIVSGYTQWSSTDYRTYIADTPSSGVSGNSVDDWVQLSTSTQDTGFGMGLDSSNNIYIGGRTADSNTNTSSFFLSRLISGNDNVVETAFGTNGSVTTQFGTNSGAFDLKVQTDDKIVLVGYTDNDIALARYNGGSLSVGEVEFKNQILIYPNPAENILNIDFNNNLFVGKEFQVYDLNGKTLMKGKIEIDTKSISIENLSKGLYVLKIDNRNIKFIKE